MTYEKISSSAKNEIPEIVKSIVIKNEQRFVDYLNNAQPLTPRVHALELIPGIGKTYLNSIIREREKKPFENCYDWGLKISLILSSILILTYFIYPSILVDTISSILIY